MCFINSFLFSNSNSQSSHVLGKLLFSVLFSILKKVHCYWKLTNVLYFLLLENKFGPLRLKNMFHRIHLNKNGCKSMFKFLFVSKRWMRKQFICIANIIFKNFGTEKIVNHQDQMNNNIDLLFCCKPLQEISNFYY